VEHDFVDGGVLNNSPIHVALDAGATHIIWSLSNTKDLSDT